MSFSPTDGTRNQPFIHWVDENETIKHRSWCDFQFSMLCSDKNHCLSAKEYIRTILCQKFLVMAHIRKNTLTLLDRNLFDLFIGVFSWLAYPLSKVPGMGCVRSVRVLRTIRVFARIDSMRLMLTGRYVCPDLVLLCPANLTLSSADARIPYWPVLNAASDFVGDEAHA